MMVNALLFWFAIGFILYIYIGYPLIVFVLSQRTSKLRVDSTYRPAVTLLIAAYNEEAVIAQKLENALELDYPRSKLQILVAADGSDDDTVKIVQSFADKGVDLSFSPAREGKLAAIANAIERVTGDIIVFSDANNMYVPTVIQSLVAPFSDPRVGAVSGAKTILKDGAGLGTAEGLYWRYESAIKTAESRLSSCVAISGEVWAARRDLYQSPPRTVVTDDFFMGMQIIAQGYRLIYVPQAKSYERVSASSKDEMERRARIVAGRYQIMVKFSGVIARTNFLVMWQIISHKFFRMFLPFAMIGAFVTNFIALILAKGNPHLSTWQLPYWFAFVLFVLQLVFYSLAWVGNRWERSKSVIGKMAYIPTFLVNSNIAAFIGFIRFITGRQSTTWQRVSR